jgi:predicted permease
MGTLFQDLRYGFRTLRKNPSFTAIAVLTLALGIGANTAVFGVVNAVLIRQLPYRDADRLAVIWNDFGAQGQSLPQVTPPDLLFYQQASRTMDFASMYGSGGIAVTSASSVSESHSQHATLNFVSSNFFPLLGVAPILGRTFGADESVLHGPRVVMISHRFWQRHFLGDPNVIGTQLPLDGEPATVVGVLPPQFTMMLPAESTLPDADLWQPVQIDYNGPLKDISIFFVLGKLKPSVTFAQAQVEMDGIAQQLQRTVSSDASLRIRVVPMKVDLVKKVRLTLLVLLGAVGFVLLIACANVTNLLLARSTARQKEIAIRSALGAMRARIVRQILTESFLLSVAGAGAGIVLAYWGLNGLQLLRPASLARFSEAHLSGPVLLFSVGACLLTTLLFGVVPALVSAGVDPGEALKQGGKSMGGDGHNRVRGLLIIVEVALSLVLFAGAGLLVRSFTALQRVSPGFDSKRLVTFRGSLPQRRYATPADQEKFLLQIEQRVTALSGVQSVGITNALPLTGEGPQTSYAWDPASAKHWDDFTADWYSISPRYFQTMKATLLEGRYFTEQDDSQHPPVVIVDETLAHHAWPHESAIGKKLMEYSRVDNAPRWYEIVGVVQQLRAHDLRQNVREQIYNSNQQEPDNDFSVAIQTQLSSLDLRPAIEREVAGLDQNLAIRNLQSMDDYVATEVAPMRFSLVLIGVFGALALALTCFGVYGVIAYSVSRRTREIGLRMALGAKPSDVLRMLIGQSSKLVLCGVAAGLAGALGLTRFLSSQLFGVRATDPATFFSVTLALSCVALLACYVPARRAMRVDPVVALRDE